MEYPVLIRVKDKSIKVIKETPFYVGFNPACDMCVSNNALNDVHFSIASHNGKYVVFDHSIHNYTSVDDDFIISSEEIELKEKSIIRAANELFIFVKGDCDFIPENKRDERRKMIGSASIRARRRRKVQEIAENFKFATAENAFISFMKDSCVDDVVVFAYEMPNQSCDSKNIVVCVSTKEQKGKIKHLRDVYGKTDKISNAERTLLKMSDDCEIEVLDNFGNEIANESFCWAGMIFFKDFEVSTSTQTVTVNLKRCGKLTGTVKLEL